MVALYIARICKFFIERLCNGLWSGSFSIFLACSAGVFWVGESLLIGSLRWSRHLWFYDRGRLGRVVILTLTVGVALSRLKPFAHARWKRLHCRLASSPHPIPYFSSFYCFISVTVAWNGGSWLDWGDLPAMGAVCYPGDGWPQWKPLGIPDTHLPLKRGSWFRGQSWRVLKFWYTGGDPEQRFQLCFADGLTRVKCQLLRRLDWPTIKNNAFWASDTCGSNSGQF